MVCLICDDFFHETSNCDQVINEKARKKIAKEKEFCQFCFAKSVANHHPGEKCKTNKKCSGHFSTEHHTVFCPKRITEMVYLFPKIDDLLFPRFLQTLDIDEEKYLGVLSSPKLLKMIPLIPIIVVDLMRPNHINRYPNSTVIVRRNMMLDYYRNPKFFNLLSSKKIICNARVLNIKYMKIMAKELWLLLSKYTKSFDIYKTKITPSVKFSECLERTPSIEEFSIHETNIEIEATWLDDLLKLQNLNSFQLLKLTIDGINFDVNKLAKFIMEKCTKNVTIDLTITINTKQYANVAEAKRHFMKKILNRFVKNQDMTAMSATGLFINIVEISVDGSKKIARFGGYVLKSQI